MRTVRTLQDPLGARHVLSRDAHGVTQRTRKGLGDRFSDVMRLTACQHPDVKRRARVIDESTEQLAEVVHTEPMRITLEPVGIEREEGAARQVERYVRERLVHGHEGVTVPLDASGITESRSNGVPQDDAYVLGKVVHVDDILIALRLDVESEAAMAAQSVEHVREKSVCDVEAHLATIKVDGDPHVGLAGRPRLLSKPSHASPPS